MSLKTQAKDYFINTNIVNKTCLINFEKVLFKRFCLFKKKLIYLV